MFVCNACAVFYYNDDYSGTDWSESRADEIAENLSGIDVIFEDEPIVVDYHCMGCDQRGIDAYRAGYYDHHGELVV